MFLSPNIILFFTVEFFIFVYFIFVLMVSLKLLKQFDKTVYNEKQFNIEKKIYLINGYINVLLVVKIILFFQYFFIMDQISQFIPGAMCAIGSHNAFTPSYCLIFLKILVLFLSFYWIVVHRVDIKYPILPYTKIKLIFTIVICVAIFCEIIFEIVVFYYIDPNKIVSCCGTLFSEDGKLPGILGMRREILIVAHFFIYFVAYIFRDKKFVFAILSVLFFAISIVLLIVFHSSYIYQEPSHRCPFCILQKDYYYIGYFIYFILLVGFLFGTGRFFIHKIIGEDFVRWSKYSLLANLFYILLVYFIVLKYFMVNGVWLF